MGAMNSVLTFFGFGPGESASTETTAKPRVTAARRRSGLAAGRCPAAGSGTGRSGAGGDGFRDDGGQLGR